MFLYKKSFGALRKYAGLQNTANLEPTFFVCSSGSHTLHHAVWKHRDGHSYRVALRGTSIVSVTLTDKIGNKIDLMHKQTDANE